MDILRYMDEIESRLDRQQEDALLKAWTDFADQKNTRGPFSPPRRVPSCSRISWPKVSINDALEDGDAMLLSQLSKLNELLEEGSEKPLCIRANYGVGNVASLFGAKPYVMPRERASGPNG